jgi:hypothetical protein
MIISTTTKELRSSSVVVLISLEVLMRKLTAAMLVPFMRLTGFRFSKFYRWEVSIFHSVVYRMVDTVGANIKADS